MDTAYGNHLHCGCTPFRSCRIPSLRYKPWMQVGGLTPPGVWWVLLLLGAGGLQTRLANTCILEHAPEEVVMYLLVQTCHGRVPLRLGPGENVVSHEAKLMQRDQSQEEPFPKMAMSRAGGKLFCCQSFLAVSTRRDAPRKGNSYREASEPSQELQSHRWSHPERHLDMAPVEAEPLVGRTQLPSDCPFVPSPAQLVLASGKWAHPSLASFVGS